MALVNHANDTELTEYPDSFPIYVSQHIGDVKLGEYGVSPVRAMLDVVGRHAENIMAGEHAEYHADVLGQTMTVVVAMDSHHD